jgi:site-specific DNA-adenine methylase
MNDVDKRLKEINEPRVILNVLRSSRLKNYDGVKTQIRELIKTIKQLQQEKDRYEKALKEIRIKASKEEHFTRSSVWEIAKQALEDQT